MIGCLYIAPPIILPPRHSHLIGVDIIAMLSRQCPPHGQVDDISYDGQRESCAEHDLPLTHFGEDGCGEPVWIGSKDMVGNIYIPVKIRRTGFIAGCALTREESLQRCPCGISLACQEAQRSL